MKLYYWINRSVYHQAFTYLMSLVILVLVMFLVGMFIT